MARRLKSMCNACVGRRMVSVPGSSAKLFGALGAYPIVLGDRRKKQKQDTVQPYEAADGAPKSMENADDTDKHLDA